MKNSNKSFNKCIGSDNVIKGNNLNKYSNRKDFVKDTKYCDEYVIKFNRLIDNF